MKTFELYDAASVDDVVRLLDEHGPASKIVAGGSDLVTGVMKDWVHGPGMPYPTALIDIITVQELHGIRAEGGALRIGAATTLTEMVESEEVRNTWPILAESAFSVASPLIRNFATVGGNINQRPRCWFLRGEDFPCYKKGGDFCFAVTGDNTYHAIIGGELCYIVHPSDVATAMLALNATTTIAGPDGQRQVAFDEYFIGPREDVLRENILQHNELMVDIFVPEPVANTRMAWIKLKDRQVYDFALTSVAISAVVDNGVWTEGRIVLGGVSPVPWRAVALEQNLAGKDIQSAARSAASLIRNEARPMSNNAYKVDIAIGLTERALLSLLA